MDKNKFDTIQDWHELLKTGIITEEDFNKIKQSLLKAKEVPIVKKETGNIYAEEASEITIHKIETVPKEPNEWLEEIIGLLVVIIAVVAFILYSLQK